MPEHAERIDGNQILKQDIIDILGIFDFEADEVLEKITEFVNQNYIFKGTLPTKISGILVSELNDFDNAICPDGERHDILAIMDNKIPRIVEAILA